MQDEAAYEPLLYPAWKQAVEDFVTEVRAGTFKPGDTIPKEWFIKHLGIAWPEGAVTYEQWQKAELHLLQQITPLREALLEEHNISLHKYQYVPPKDQARIAWEEHERKIKRNFTKMAKEVSHVALDQLSADERKEQADMMARAATCKGLVQQIGRIPKLLAQLDKERKEQPAISHQAESKAG